MRILRLDLERYGRFTDVSMEVPADKDLCMILGRNEAGKSTALSALLDLLFGFPARASYHFQHDHKALRVGALLAHSDGRETHLRRRRGNKNTLLGADETALNDALITPFQGGINRDQFERLFGLDQERLRQGGEAMLRSDGAVGAILVEAGEGLKGLVQLQHRLTQELDQLHRAKRNQNTETARIQSELKEARDRLRQCLLSADEWHDALAYEQRCVDLVQSLRTETLTLRATAARLAMLARVKPILARLDELAAAADALGSLPELADTIDQDRLELRNQLIGDQARLAVARTELAKVALQLQALPAADPILGHSNRIAGFAETRGAVEKARQDSARRELEIQASRTRLAALAKQLGAPDGDSAVIQAPDALSRADLQQLESEGTRIQAKLDAAQNALRQAEADLPVEDAAGDGNAAERLRAVQAQLRRLETRRDLPQQVEELAGDQIRYRQARIELDQSLAALPYWTGTLDELLRLALPLRGAVEAELAASQERQQELDRFLEQRATTKLEQERWQHVLDELAGEGPVPTDEAVSLARQERDQSWRHLRRRFIERRTDLEPGPELSPDQHGDAFELQITRADELIDARARESQRLARHGQARADLAAAGRRLGELAQEIAAADAAIVAAGADWTARWSRLGVAATTPRLMLEWLERVADIRTAATELAKESRALQSRQDALDKALSELDQLESLSDLATDPAKTVEQRLDRLTQRLTVLDEEASAQVELTGTLGQARKTLQQAKETLDRAQSERADWHGRWTVALTRAGLKVDTSLVATKAALELFSEIDTEVRNLAQAEYRLATMAADEAAFAAAVTGVAAGLGLTMADQDPIAISRSLEQRQQTARHSHDQRQKLEGEHATRVQAVGDLETLIAEHEARACLLRTAAGANSEDELDDIVRRRKQLQELLHQQAELRQQLLAEGGEHSEAFLRAEAASLDDAQLREQRVQVDARLAQLDDAVVHAVARHTEAIQVRQQLEQRTGAAAAAQEVAQRLAELGEVASQWAQLRATLLLLNAAIERYRKRQSDPLLAKASHYLACLTCNACTGFAVDFDERDEPRLGVERPTGDILPVSGLSEGTRDQLWLALRLAAIERHVAAAEPLPFIGDDVLVNFDDERATAALKALADLGACCQVLLFTHHPHLVDLGRAALGPRLGVVDLAA